MNIVLDTNVFLQDLFMTSRNFELLFDYLEKTNSRIILPRIVYEELSGRYRSRLSSQIEAMEIARRKLEKTLLSPELPLPVVDIDKEVDRYLDFVLDKLGITESSIIEHKPHYLSELVSRSVKRLKPFTERGEEFRDALLWLSVLDIAQELCGGILAFISCDTKAFGQAEAIHSELLEDIQRREVQINYYDSIKAFIEHHAVQVEFIDKPWLLQTVAFEKFDEEITNRIAERLVKVESISWYSSHRSEWEGL
jgi:predicted nucleic acid-binding protein